MKCILICYLQVLQRRCNSWGVLAFVLCIMAVSVIYYNCCVAGCNLQRPAALTPCGGFWARYLKSFGTPGLAMPLYLYS